MTLPQTNGQLTGVHSPTAATGDRDDWDHPGTEPTGAGDQKWAGAEGSYVFDKTERVVSGTGDSLIVDHVPVRRLIVPADVALASGVAVDDLVTFTGPRGEETMRVQSVDVSRLPGMPIEVQTARLRLDLDAPA